MSGLLKLLAPLGIVGWNDRWNSGPKYLEFWVFGIGVPIMIVGVVLAVAKLEDQRVQGVKKSEKKHEPKR